MENVLRTKIYFLTYQDLQGVVNGNLLRPINPPAPKELRRCVGSRRLEDQLLDKQLKL